ncbi:MAG: hypothetical protein ACM3OB_01660, partial [Acidobacteriota bacterium]
PGFERGAPASSAGGTGGGQPERPEEGTPSQAGLPSATEVVALGVAAPESESGPGTGESREASPGRRPTAPWPTLWTEPEAAPPSDVLTPPEPPAAAAEVLSSPEPQRWTPPAIPDRKPFSVAEPVGRSGRRIGLLVVVLVVAVLGGAGYYFRGPLLALVGRGASGPPPAAAPKPAPEVATTPAGSPSPVPVGQSAGTLHDEVAGAVPAAPQASRAPTGPAADAAMSAAAPGPTASPPPSPLVARQAASPSDFGGLVRVRWQANAEGLLVLLECDGPLNSSRFDTTRLEGTEPRQLVRLLGVRRPFDQTRIAVGVGPLKQIRIGYHAGARAELYVVLDLASSAAKAVSVEPQGNVLRIQLVGK